MFSSYHHVCCFEPSHIDSSLRGGGFSYYYHDPCGSMMTRGIAFFLFYVPSGLASAGGKSAAENSSPMQFPLNILDEGIKDALFNTKKLNTIKPWPTGNYRPVAASGEKSVKALQSLLDEGASNLMYLTRNMGNYKKNLETKYRQSLKKRIGEVMSFVMNKATTLVEETGQLKKRAPMLF